jgi:hypothetical protein
VNNDEFDWRKEHAMISVHNAYSGRQEFYSEAELAAFTTALKRKSMYSDTTPHILAYYFYQDWRKGAGREYEARAQEAARLEAAQELAAIKAELAAMQRDCAARRLRRVAPAEPALKYNPNQPRVPAGGENGGQWTSGGGGEGLPNNPIEAFLNAFFSIFQQASPMLVAEDITGFSKHGLNQAINRGVSPSAILDATRNPLTINPRPNGTTQYIGSRATVVLNPSGRVVTMWPTTK